MRELDGMKIAFVQSKVYFEGFHTPSMYSTSKETGADIVILLAPGKVEADLSDDYIRGIIRRCAANVSKE